MAASPLIEDPHGFFESHGFFVGALRGQSIEDISYGKDARHPRCVAACMASKVSGAVIPLMVVTHHRGRVFEPGGAAHDIQTVPDMLLHLFEFLIGKLSGFEKD